MHMVSAPTYPAQSHTPSVFIFGNPDLPEDSLPLRLLPALRAAFPDVAFEVLDPNEEWEVPRHVVIIDTVVNLAEVAVFHDLSAFIAAPRVTCHDFDAYANLLLLKKLGKIEEVTIIGVPPTATEEVRPRVVGLLRGALDTDTT